MADVHGVVYDPPSAGFPPVVVIFYEGEVIGARAAPSVEAGEAFLAKVINEFAAKIAGEQD